MVAGTRVSLDSIVYAFLSGQSAEAIAQAAGLTGFQLRDLRHEAASRFEKAGVLTTDVSKFLGHRDAQGARQSVNDIQRGRLPSSLQITQVGPVQARAIGPSAGRRSCTPASCRAGGCLSHS
jgi:hypothetical protein